VNGYGEEALVFDCSLTFVVLSAILLGEENQCRGICRPGEFPMQGPLPLFDVPKDKRGVSRGMFAVAASTSNRPKLDPADLPSPPQNGNPRPR
jgi:hypothetical protein